MSRYFFRIVLGPSAMALGWMCALTATAQSATNFKTEAFLLKNIIQQKHFSPPAINDAFSAVVFDNFLDDLDPDRMLFTEADIQNLKPFRGKIDDELNGKNWSFLSTVAQTYKKCLARSSSSILQYTQGPFDFSTKEYDVNDSTWAKDETALSVRWRLALKYETLARLAEIKTKFPNERPEEFLKKHEPEVRGKVKANNIARGKRILFHPSGYENYVGVAFLHAMASSADAHTSYMSPKDMETFMASLSTQGLYFGVTLKDNEWGDAVIDRLAPGGPAWKSGQVFVGDIIQRLRWAGRDWIDLSGMDLSEVGAIMDESNHLSLDFELKNVSGEQKIVTLRKEKISDEENVVRSFVIEGEKKIGYIFLPGFYSNWGDAGGSRCANDVAKAIIKLKKENINGLILDVRFNGGGSLEEAVALAGIFIDAGPIGVMKNRAGEIVSEKDMNRGTIYDGPLVLMVNALSASASDFLAAALQDYHRAIVVGSRTYGKATAQEIFSLDPKSTAANFATVKNLYGYASVTHEKVYRITGKTAQRMGVTPDIALPDVLDVLGLREEDQALTLPSDSVQKKTYYQPLALLPIAYLEAKSQKRVATVEAFKTLTAYGQLLEKNDDPVPLFWADFMTLRDKHMQIAQNLEKEREAPAPYTVNSTGFEQERLAMDEYTRNLYAAWIKKMQQDISLEEAFHILCDYITTFKK